MSGEPKFFATPAALRREDRSLVYSYEQPNGLELSVEYERLFKKNPAAWNHYRAQPPWYRRTSARWVMSAKKEETRRRRLGQLIDCSAQARPIAPLDRRKG